MNKKLLRVALLVAVVAVAGLGVHKAQAKKPIMSDLMMANVEALGSNESLVEIVCYRTCADGVGRCYHVYDEYGNCHFIGSQEYTCRC